MPRRAAAEVGRVPRAVHAERCASCAGPRCSCERVGRRVILGAVSKAASSPSADRPIAPGPKGHPLFGMLPEFRGDRLSFLVRTARTYGPVARFRIRNRSVFLVTDPAGIKRVLQDNADNYGRKTRSVDALKETLGNGLLTTTGPSWWRNRRLAQPSFHKQRLAGFAGIMASSSADFVDRLLRAGAAGASFDIVPELSSVTLSILGRCLFERDLTDEADAVGGALRVVLHHTIDKLGDAVPAAGRRADAEEPALPCGAARAGSRGDVADRRAPPRRRRSRRPAVDAAGGARRGHRRGPRAISSCATR